MKSVFYYDTRLGRIGFGIQEGAITNLYYGQATLVEGEAEEETPLHREALGQLEEYLRGERKAFDLPLRPQGTPFQQAAWKALLEIPYGETRSYKWQAAAIGNEKACRAVGMANNQNPIPIFIPCHRVVGADGGLVGFGLGTETKQRLLELEAGCTQLRFD